MLRFIKGNLTTIDGIAIYPIISLVTFTFVFGVMLYFVIKMKKKDIDTLRNLPLEDD